jgi:hypothetical protein
VSQKGEYNVAGSSDDAVYFLDDRGEVLWQFKTLGEVVKVATSANGEFVVAGSKDSTIYFFDNNVFFQACVKGAKDALAGIRDQGINTLEADVLLQKAELELRRKEYTSAINYALGAEKVASRLKEKTKPEISLLSVVYESFALNQPTKANTIIMNTGSSHAHEVRIEYKGVVEIAGERRYKTIEMNRFFETAFVITPRQAGTIPVRFGIGYKDFEGKEYIVDTTLSLHVDPVKKSSYSSSKPLFQLGNIPKLVKKVQAAKKGKAAAVKKPPAAKTAAPTCSVCGKQVQPEWTGCPFCLTKLR